MEAILADLNDLGNWNVCLGRHVVGCSSCNCDGTCGRTVYAARIVLEAEDGRRIVRGAINEDMYFAVEQAVVMVTDALEEEDYDDEELGHATEVLRATLDEVGFDRAVALLERLNNL